MSCYDLEGIKEKRKNKKEIMDLKPQVNKLEEENRILRGIIAKNITSPPTKRET